MDNNTILIILLIVIPYILLFYSKQRLKKLQKIDLEKSNKFLESLKKDDYVLTVFGLYGKIIQINGDEVTLNISKDNDIIVLKSSIMAKK